MSPSNLDDIYGAIADPTRRAILAALTRGDVTVGALAERFPMSLNGVSKHIKVLEGAGLVARRVDGREHWLRLRPSALRDASLWLDRYRAFWDEKLDALEAMLVAEERAAKPMVKRGKPTRRVR